jgi:hypothetical protein
LAALVVFLSACAPEAALIEPPPPDPSQEPIQTQDEAPAPFEVSRGSYRFRLHPLAAYILRGVVLGRERYSSGPAGALAPFDVAVAWGAMAQDGLYRKLEWSQSGRWYWWEYGSAFSRDNAFVARYTSNTHVIPGSEPLRRAVRSLKAGDVVELSGELVRAEGTGAIASFRWKSSLNRNDRDAGSCELLYLRRLKVGERVYR